MTSTSENSQSESVVKTQADVEAVEPKAPVALEPPDGGLRAWLCVLGCALGLFTSFGWIMCIGIFQAQYEVDQLSNYSTSEISWITSTEFFMMLFFSPIAGIIYDNYGPTPPLAIGTFLHVFGLMMLSLSKEYYQILLSQSICSAIGASLIFNATLNAPQTWFKKKAIIAMSLTVSGSSIGGVVFPLMAEHLIKSQGFGWTVRICAFVILGVCLVALATIKSFRPPTKKPFKPSRFVKTLLEPKMALLCTAGFFMYWGYSTPLNYLVTNAIHRGMTVNDAFNLVPIFSGASFFGRTVPNLFAVKLGRFNLLNIMLVFSGILCLSLWLLGSSNVALILFAVFFGFSSGACIGIGPMLIYSISSMEEVGYNMGMLLAVAGVACLTSPPISGAIIADQNGGYEGVAVLSGVSFLVSAVGVEILQRWLCKWNFSAKI